MRYGCPPCTLRPSVAASIGEMRDSSARPSTRRSLPLARTGGQCSSLVNRNAAKPSIGSSSMPENPASRA